MNIASIYPNGVEKGKPSLTRECVENRELKRKVLAMADRGIRIFKICEKLNVDKSTIKGWQEAAERY